MSTLPQSPVVHAFSGIQWDPMQKLRLTTPEKLLLRSAEANPIDYTLNNREESAVRRLENRYRQRLEKHVDRRLPRDVRQRYETQDIVQEVMARAISNVDDRCLITSPTVMMV